LPGLGLPADFAKKVRETLGLTEEGVKILFKFEEDKKGFFVAKLKPKQFLENPQFRAMCALVRDLGGQDYLQGAKAWKVPGVCAKEAPEKPSGQGMDSEPAYKEPGNAIPTERSGVTPHAIALDKSKPPQTTVPLKALLAMPFQCRISPEGPGLLELTESIRTYGVLEPVLVRPKPSGLYEIVYGQRRAKAAEKAGLTDIPANIRILSDQEAYEIQFTENLQRENLSDMEKARMLDYLIKKFGCTQEVLAKKFSKERVWVARHLAMLNLETVSPGIQTGTITERQAREILAAPEEKREEILDQMRESGQIPSAREIRRAVHPEVESAPEEEAAGEDASDKPKRGQRKEEQQLQTGPKALLTGFEVECPECHKKLLINHIAYPGGECDHEVELQ